MVDAEAVQLVQDVLTQEVQQRLLARLLGLDLAVGLAEDLPATRARLSIFAASPSWFPPLRR